MLKVGRNSMVTSGINPEVTVAMMRKVVIVPDMKSKIPDIVVKYAGLDGPEALEITPKLAFSGRYENLVFIPDSTQ